MTLKAGQIIAAARDSEPAFTKQVIPPAMAYRLLTATARQCLSDAQLRKEDYFLLRASLAIHGAVTAPFRGLETISATRFDAAGVPYVDVAAPLDRYFDVGLPLPTHQYLWYGTVFFLDSSRPPVPLKLVDGQHRGLPTQHYAAYVQSRALFLLGDKTHWDVVRSIDLRYAAVHPPVSGDQTVLLLGDEAEEVLILGLAMRMMRRAESLQLPVDGQQIADEFAAELARWLDALSNSPKVFSFVRGPTGPVPAANTFINQIGSGLLPAEAEDEAIASDGYGAE